VTVVEPRLTLDKDVSGDGDDDDVRTTQPGDRYTYSLTVRSTGTAPAHDVELTDALDARRLVNVVPLANPAATVTDGDATDGTLAWTIPGPIAPNASVTVQYTADLAPSAQLRDGDAVLNTADVPAYWGVADADRRAEPGRAYREYDDVPADTVRLDVDLPRLAVEKTTGGVGFPDSAVAEVGEPFPWRVRVTNTATVASARAVDVEDVLPANWDYVAGSASFVPGGASEPTILAAAGGDRLTWSDVGDLAPGASLVLTFQALPTVDAIADPGSGAGSPNVNDVTAAAVDASGADASGDGPYADDDDAQAILELPVLAVAKTPDGDTVAAGDDASYAIVVRNDGDVPARDVLVEDVLGAGQGYRAGDASALPATGFRELSVVSGPGAGETSIEWTIDEIPARGSVTITLPVATDPSLADDTPLANGVAVTSREITTPVSDDGSYRTSVSADVGIVKTAPAGTVNAGDEVDFELLVTNDGPSDATGVTVEDALPANLGFVSADAPCAEAAGVVRCAIGRLAAGASTSLRLRLRIDPNETVEVENTATVTTTSPDPNPANDRSTARKTVAVEADLAVAKDGPALPVLQGTSFDYAIRVENVGASAATDVRLSDLLPAGVAYEAVRTTAGTCGENGGTIECSFGTLQPSDAATVTVTVRAVDVGSPVNTAVVTTTATESTTANNRDDAAVTIVPAADLGVTKTAPPTVDPGGQIGYQLGVRNNGPSDATGVTLTDTLPAGVQFVSADPGCAEAAGVVTCAVGALAVGDSRTYAVTVTAPHALGGQTLVNSVVVGGNEGDLVVANDSAQAATRVGDSADLTLSKTSGGAIAGEDASWTIIVRNDGPSTATPVTVTDQLPAGATPTAATPSQGGCAISGQDVVCGIGNLPPGGAAQINVIADVAPNMAGQPLRNSASVTAPQSDPVLSNDDDAVTTIVAVPSATGPDLALTKTASTRRPRLGVPFRYDLLVRNIGGEPARRARVLDTLSRALDVRSVRPSSGRCTRDGGRIACTLGTLAPDASATIAVTVVPTEPGALRNTASTEVGEGADVNPANNRDAVDVRVRAPRASWTLAKRADRRAVRGGKGVSFALSLRVGTRAVADAVVCDRLPDGLAFVRVPGARFREGRACWSFDYLAPGARRTLHVTARAERGFAVRRVRNIATAAARNAPRRTAAATVRIEPALGAAGGVTG
jgi:large repetitive protein